MTEENVNLTPAQQLGAKFKANRVKHNLSLIDVSDKLQIRSFVLNDIENGNFSHLKQGECLAYAKYLGIDLDEVRKVYGNKTVSVDNSGNSNKLRSIVGIFAIVAITIGVVLLISQALSGKKDEAEKVVVGDSNQGTINLQEVTPAPSENEVDVQLLENSEAQEKTPNANNVESVSITESDGSEEIPLPAPTTSTKEQGQLPVTELQENVEPASVQEGIVVGNDNTSKVAPVDNTVAKVNTTPKAEKKEPVKVSQSDAPAMSTSVKANHVPTQKTIAQGRSGKDPNTNGKTQRPSMREQAKQNANKPAPKQENTGVELIPTRKPLKAGEIRSLADELGIKNNKKTSTQSKGQPVKNQVAQQPAAARPLKAGEVRSLASEVPNKTVSQVKASTVQQVNQQAVVPAKQVTSKMVSGTGRLYDPNEIKRKASQVVIGEGK